MSTNYLTGGLIGARLDEPSSTADFRLGQVEHGIDGTMFMYVVASGAINQYDLVGVNEDFDAYPLTTALAAQSDVLGLAQVAFSSGQYGWVARTGAGDLRVRTKASAAADAQLWTTASAGVVDDATSAGALKLDGIVLAAAASTAANGSAGIKVKAAWPAIRET